VQCRKIDDEQLIGGGNLPFLQLIAGTKLATPAARKRISAAMKARWAARKRGTTSKKPAKTATKKSAGRPRMSPAARKKLSALMKARWAARKKQGASA